MRLLPSDFYDLTPWEFWRQQEGYVERERDRTLLQWRVARWHASIAIAPHVKKPPEPTKLLPLPDDQEEKEIEMSGDDFILMFASQLGAVTEIKGEPKPEPPATESRFNKFGMPLPAPQKAST